MSTTSSAKPFAADSARAGRSSGGGCRRGGRARSAETRPSSGAPIAALVILALLLAAIAAFVGSQRRVPPPFGPAENGLVAFVRGGDIFTYDPVTRLEMPLVADPDEDLDPAWSLDGTRVAFVRRRSDGDVIGFVDRDGGRPIVQHPAHVRDRHRQHRVVAGRPRRGRG